MFKKVLKMSKVMLNVGCGKDVLEGFVNIDYHVGDGVDLVHDIRNPLPFDDCSVDFIYCSHVLEDFLLEWRDIVRDFYRVLKHGGVCFLKMPHSSQNRFWGSGYHERPFAWNSLDWICAEDTRRVEFVENYASELGLFVVNNRKINFIGYDANNFGGRLYYNLVGRWNEALFNRMPRFYEITMFSNLFPASDIQFELVKG